MLFAVLSATLALLLDLLHALTRGEQDKTLEIVVLRQQLRRYERTVSARPRLSRWDKLVLATIVAKYRALASALVLVQPATVLRRHRAIVRRQWTYGNTPKRGRPSTPAATVDLIVRFARENPAWGYSKLQGELLKVGHRVSRATIRRVLRRQGLPPAARRGRTTWRAFLAQHCAQLLACDFFAVDTLFLQRLYVLFFIELGSRRLHLAGCTAAPDAVWVTQQARQLSWRLQDGEVRPLRFLIRDRDGKFPASFARVFASEGLTIVKTPPQTPNANAVAERAVRSIRAECLDRFLIVNQAHLRSVLADAATPGPGSGTASAARRCPDTPRRPRADPVSASPRWPHQRLRRRRLKRTKLRNGQPIEDGSARRSQGSSVRRPDHYARPVPLVASPAPRVLIARRWPGRHAQLGTCSGIIDTVRGHRELLHAAANAATLPERDPANRPGA